MTPKEERDHHLNHELRGCITTIEGLINLLAKEGADPAMIKMCRSCFVKFYNNLIEFGLVLDIQEAQSENELDRVRQNLAFLSQAFQKKGGLLLILNDRKIEESGNADKSE